MNPKCFSRALLVLTLVALINSVAVVRADDSARTPGEMTHSFGDKIVVISIEMAIGGERYSSSATLKDAKLVKLGDRTFIRGIGYVAEVDEHNKKIAWFDGIDVAYSWDSVVDFYSFTPQQLEKYRSWVKSQEN
jgi:hypothetical protein